VIFLVNIGVDYYPEQWDRSIWQHDVDIMAQIGVKIVRLAEFAWSKLEPLEDEFSFEWLDTIIDMFTKKNIKIVLCTPTNCPPLWLYEKYPDAIQVDKNGNRLAIGIRGHRCYNSINLLKRVETIIDKITSHYKDNPNIVAYQIDNELEANFCRCEVCQSKFRSYLKSRYSTIDTLNKSYGNSVWSGEYSSWTQIKAPMGYYSEAWYNPSLMLDYNRFASKDTIEYVNFQIECIRKNCKDIPITTNTWFCQNSVDFHEMFKNLDFVSYDNYPTTKIPKDDETLYSHAFHLDLMRGIKDKNFWIMEQLSGGLGSWSPMSQTTQPNMVKGYSLQAFAHGANTVIHFRWRTATTGAEMHWHGIIDHNNYLGRRFHEFADLCKVADTLKDIQNSEYKSNVGILYSAENDYAFKIQPQTDGMYYLQQLKSYHDAFTKFGVNVDIISEFSSLQGYKIIVAPTMYITNDIVVKNLYKFVEDGGMLILTNRSGVKDIDNNCIMDTLPTVYKDLIGAWIEEYNPIGYEKSEIDMLGEKFKVSHWCDILNVTSAESVATYSNDKDFYKGKTAVSKNNYGNGVAYYVGTLGERKFYHKLIENILKTSNISYFKDIPNGIEITIRQTEDTQFRFIFNNTDSIKEVNLNGEMLELNPFDMVVKEFKS